MGKKIRANKKKASANAEIIEIGSDDWQLLLQIIIDYIISIIIDKIR